MFETYERRAWLYHCLDATDAGNDRSYPSGLTLIDGAILGQLSVNAEHAYRMAHHRDVEMMRTFAVRHYLPRKRA